MILEKKMYSLIKRVCRLQNPECKTDIEALETELNYTIYIKDLKQSTAGGSNINCKDEIELISILRAAIEDEKLLSVKPKELIINE